MAAAWAQTGGTAAVADAPGPNRNALYLKRAAQRFSVFAGSNHNAVRLTSGLRGGTEITLKGSGETAVFTPPTRPMGYGNITRTLDLAQRQLAAQGMTHPTPKEIQAALMGGTVRGPDGEVSFEGVLQLRSQAMGWDRDNAFSRADK